MLRWDYNHDKPKWLLLYCQINFQTFWPGIKIFHNQRAVSNVLPKRATGGIVLDIATADIQNCFR